MIRNVILDAGGVICFPRTGSWLIPIRFMDIIGTERLNSVSGAELARAMDAASKIYLDESLMLPDESYEYAVRRNYFKDIAKRLDWKLTDYEADLLSRDMTENDARYDFYDDAREGIRALGEKYRLGLLSDAMPSLKRVFDNAGLLEMFDGAVLSTEVGAIKPDEKMYKAILTVMEAEAENCVFIDDKISNLIGAEKCGMRVIHMDRDGMSDWPGVKAKDLFEALRMIDNGKF